MITYEFVREIEDIENLERKDYFQNRYSSHNSNEKIMPVQLRITLITLITTYRITVTTISINIELWEYK